MQKLASQTEALLIASALATQAAPPPAFRAAPGSWTNGQLLSAIPQVEVEVWAVASQAVTGGALYGAIGIPLPTFAPAAVTFDHTDGEVTLAAHGLSTGDGPFQFTNVGGALPAGVLPLTDYWVSVVDANTFKLATSLDDVGTATLVAFTSNGTGTTTITADEDAQHLIWREVASLNPPGGTAGTMALTGSLGVTLSAPHLPNTLAYAVVWTIAASGTASCRLNPLVDYGG